MASGVYRRSIFTLARRHPIAFVFNSTGYIAISGQRRKSVAAAISAAAAAAAAAVVARSVSCTLQFLDLTSSVSIYGVLLIMWCAFDTSFYEMITIIGLSIR